ncbi:hypothetical protein [Chitinophaga arvensicola]|uniref:3-keto-disaccharide hydrolase domain-containing protein n=1 Tax=Chitinophaga arvensicola TaxID=29529 RepID=A0A1I0SB09_9BACT|nr:hypothetical protein [Chitinophaga arvensicola]SEW53820.1 hypothetical protein SAMN04488122_5699 [Chitinophaga arvensicola]
MTKTAAAYLLCLFPLWTMAQKRPTAIQVPLQASNWEFRPGGVEFTTYKSVPAMKILTTKDSAVLKQLDFTNGTIEYDMEPLDPYFTSFYFRRNSKAENECFYFRTAEAGKGDAVQYAPHLGGINLWDMLPEYQSATWFAKDQWNHVKLVISGKQMRVYVNDTIHPVLQVPRLEGNTTDGGLAFDGQAIIANLVVKPAQTEALSPDAGIDITDNDPRYLRQWQLSTPITTPVNLDFSLDWKPAKDAAWESIWAERKGLINLTRKFGGMADRARRIVWLKTNIHSTVAQVRQVSLGFSDEVWVFVNGNFAYVDKNLYSLPAMKQPDGRCSIDNASFSLPLKAGDNEVMIAVANNFYGWGIIARLDKFENLTFGK